MARKGRKGRKGRGRSRGRKSVRRTPKTVKGVIKSQPLAVKGGIAVSALNLVSDPQLVFQLQNKQWSNALSTVKNRAMTTSTYVPIVVGIFVHKGAKMLGVKGI